MIDMNVLDEWIHVPTPEHVSLLKYVLVFTNLLHQPYIGTVMGCALFSLILQVIASEKGNEAYEQLPGRIMDMPVFRTDLFFLMGILPMFVVVLVHHQILYRAGITLLSYQFLAIVLMAVGFILILVHKKIRSEVRIPVSLRIGPGVAGLAAVLVAYYVFYGVSTRLIDPEKWVFIQNPADLLVSWNLIAKYLMLLSLGVIVAGVVSLVTVFNWGRFGVGGPGSGERFLLYFCAGAGVLFSPLLPLFLIWYLFTAPVVALSLEVYAAFAVGIFFLAMAGRMLFKTIEDARPKYAIHAFVLMVVVMFSFIMADHFARENAIREHTMVLKRMAEEAGIWEEKAEEAETGDTRGAKVFQKHCVVCHSFERDIVGPALSGVLPKYENDIESLKQYIKKLVKINPDYTMMPELGLSDDEIDAVVEYLSAEMKNHSEGGPAGE